jgi:CubicO group peptidase (beta-lactamase class C family)
MNAQRSIDDLLREAVKRGDVPGVAAMATTDEQTVYEGAFGVRRLGNPAPMTVDTVVGIASMTKALTSTAALQLVEQGRLELDAPAASVVPYLGDVGVLTGFDAQGKPLLRPPKRPITLRHLLTHSAGFSYELWNEDIKRYKEVMGVPATETRTNESIQTPLIADPGERWEYGVNTDWAGKLVEAASGKPLGAYLRDHLFEPLGMTSTAFRPTDPMRAQMASMHQRGDDGALSVITQAPPPLPVGVDQGGGGLLSTARDYLTFTRMILNGGAARGERILRPETVALMGMNHMGDCRVRMLKTALPARSNDAEFFPGVPKAWSLAFQINLQPAPTGRAAGSMSWAGLTNCYYWIDPMSNLAGVYMTQILPFADAKSLPLFNAFESAVYSSLR